MIVENVWGSIVKLVQSIQEDHAGWTFHDWETHANTPELPEADLIGPTTVAIEEEEAGLVRVTFAIAISSYADVNLFKHRAMAGVVFERLRPERQFVYYDATTAAVLGYIKITGGTTLAPMSSAITRPFQFVQCAAWIDPSATPAAS